MVGQAINPYPETAIQPPQAPNLLGMANQAAQLNNALLQNTGMGLEQHYKRLQGLSSALEGMYVDNGQKPLSRQTVVNGALDAAKNGLVTPSEAATFIGGMPEDPAQLQGYVRNIYAGVQNNAAALGKAMTMLPGGDVNYYRNTNSLALGGVTVPQGVHQGLPPTVAASPNNVTLPNAEIAQTTVGDRARAAGMDTGSHLMGAPAVSNNLTAPRGATSPSGITESTIQFSPAQLGQMSTNALAATPSAPPSAALTSHAPQVRGIVAPSPAEVAVMNASGTDYSAAQREDRNFTPNMATMDETIAELANASTGPAADVVAKAGALLNQAGINIGQGVSTANQLMDKATALMARNGTITGNARSDQDLRAAFEMTPNSKMTPAAAAGAVAIIQGQMEYKHIAIQMAQAEGVKPQDFNHWYTTTYQANAVSPIILAAANPNMPTEVKNTLKNYIYGLKDKDPAAFASLAKQAQQLKAQRNGGQ